MANQPQVGAHMLVCIFDLGGPLSTYSELTTALAALCGSTQPIWIIEDTVCFLRVRHDPKTVEEQLRLANSFRTDDRWYVFEASRFAYDANEPISAAIAHAWNAGKTP